MNQLYIFYQFHKELKKYGKKFNVERFIKEIVKERLVINPGIDLTVEEETSEIEFCIEKLIHKGWILVENNEYMVNQNNRGVNDILKRIDVLEKELEIEEKEEENQESILKEEKEYMKKMYEMIHEEFLKMKEERFKLRKEYKNKYQMEIEGEEKEEEEESDEDFDDFVMVKSSDGKTEYKVNTSRWTCSCPSFTYSLYDPPQCKHVYQVYIEQNKDKTDVSKYEEILTQMIKRRNWKARYLVF